MFYSDRGSRLRRLWLFFKASLRSRSAPITLRTIANQTLVRGRIVTAVRCARVRSSGQGVKAILSSLALLATSSAAAQQPGALEAAVQTTILTNPEVRARFQEFQAKLEGEHAARGA